MSDRDLLVQIHEAIGELRSDMRHFTKELDDIKPRVRRLELARAKMLGMFSLLTLPITLAVKALFKSHTPT